MLTKQEIRAALERWLEANSDEHGYVKPELAERLLVLLLP